MNVAELITEVTGLNARNQFYIYGGLLLLAIGIACIYLEGSAPLEEVMYIRWLPYQMTGL
jgi:hypothetical protein